MQYNRLQVYRRSGRRYCMVYRRSGRRYCMVYRRSGRRYCMVYAEIDVNTHVPSKLP